MTKILITGAGSYVGTSFERYLKENFEKRYQVDTIDMVDGSWREKTFVGYDVVYHVAGIAHSDKGKISEEKKKLYDSVNTELAIETAEKAKADGVKQFIFMSSAIVYGDSAPVGKKKVITKDTPVSPANSYGNSKVQAENGIRPLNDAQFKVVILRSPMIYGKGCKGNYPMLTKLARKLPVFPYIKNERSMIYIDNLAEFVRLMIENEEEGIFFPQNAEYSNTSELIRMIAESNGRKICLLKGFTWMVKLLGVFFGQVNKAFGNLCYDWDISRYREDYCKVTLAEGVKRTQTR